MTILGRIAAREARRNWVRTLLIAVLTAIPVAVVTGAVLIIPSYEAGVVRSNVERAGASEFELYMLDAAKQGPAEIDALETELVSRLGSDARLLRSIRTVGYRAVGDNRLEEFQIEVVDATDPLSEGRFPKLDGRLPTAPGEALVERSEPSSSRYSGWDARYDRPLPKAGDTLALEPHLIPRDASVDAATDVDSNGSISDRAVTVKVVGTFQRQEACFECKELVVHPGTLTDEFNVDLTGQSIAQPSWFGAYAAEMTEHELYSRVGHIESGLNVSPSFTTTSQVAFADDSLGRFLLVVGGTFLLFWTGLVAACGFAIGARRRRRELGLLAANGADPMRLRAMSVSEAGLVGILGSASGVLVGILGIWFVYQVLIPDQYADLAYITGFSPFRLQLSDVLVIVGLFALGVASCMGAAAAATNGLTRQTPAALLAGRSRRPKPVSLWLLSGAILVAVGLTIFGATANMSGKLPVERLVLGLALAIIGAVALVVGVIRIAGLFARSGAVSLRIAARDLVRQGVRTGAAASAVCLTIGVAVTVVVGLEPLPETYYLDDMGPIADARSAAEISHDSAGSQAMLFPFDPPLGVDGAWAEVEPLDFKRHDLGVTTRYQPDDEAITDLRNQGWKVAAHTMVPAPDSMHICPSTHGPNCFMNITVVDDATIDWFPEPVATALRTHGEANLVQPDGYADTPNGQDPVHYVDVDATCPGCRLSFLYDTHSALFTQEQAAVRGVDVDHVLGQHSVFVQTSPTDTRVNKKDAKALIGDLGEGWAIQAMMFDQYYDAQQLDRANSIARSIVIVGANVVAVLVIAISLALVRLESRTEDKVLSVAGASPSLSRRINSWRSLLIVVVAAIPAVPLGIAVWRIGLDQPNVPWRWLAILIGSLLVLAAMTGLFMGRRETQHRRDAV